MTITEVGFTRMDQGTTEELELIVREAQAHKQRHLVDTVIGLLEQMKDEKLGYQVDRYEHSLQTATHAHREGARVDMVVAALLHDIGDVIAPDNHSAVAAEILKPYVDDETYWVIAHHGVFQGYHYWDKLGLDPNSRDVYRGHPSFDAAAHFCAAWDQVAFDPDYDTLPLEHFEPLVRRMFAAPRTI